MSSFIVTALLWTAALGSGLIAGIYFAFSVFIMQAFGKIDASQSITANDSTLSRSLDNGTKPGLRHHYLNPVSQVNC